VAATDVEGLTGTFASDPFHSTFRFAVQHQGVAKFTATFDDVQASLVAGDAGISIEGSAQVASISIKNPPQFRDHVVTSPEFFDGGNHPEIGFRSTAVELGSDGSARVEGELTIKGIARPVTATGSCTAPVEDHRGGLRVGLELTAVVDRREWELSWQAPLPKGGNVLAWDVEIGISLSLVQQAG
jgi:polyisoprenoid-binding protein YceI